MNRMRKLLSCGFLVFLVSLNSCSNKISPAEQSPTNSLKVDSKQKGAHVFSRVDTTDFQFVKKNNIDWVTLVPWGFQDDVDSREVHHGAGDSIRVAKHNAHWIEQIKITREAGLKVFFKPHLWIHKPTDGKWRSDVFPKNEADWQNWKSSYKDFILRYAQVAEEAGAEMYCIGVELTRVALEKPEFWTELIKEVRKVYSGKLTYGANWYKAYENITFWDKLDFIGIQAYFPLTEKVNPSVEELNHGWQEYLGRMEAIAKLNNKPVLFTELGYKSTSEAAIRPWEWAEKPESQDDSFSAETQVNCYEAFFESVWPKKWFAGVHLWQFRDDFKLDRRGLNNLDFTPQGKPAEKVIEEGFRKE